MEALVIVGVAMAYVDCSRPASGSEHHLSHFFEITGILEDKPYFAHGIDVAYSAVVTAAIREQILAGEKPVEGRYAETLPADAYEKAAAELGDTARCEEDVLSYIAFPQVAEKFFAERTEREERKVAYSITKAEE